MNFILDEDIFEETSFVMETKIPFYQKTDKAHMIVLTNHLHFTEHTYRCCFDC